MDPLQTPQDPTQDPQAQAEAAVSAFMDGQPGSPKALRRSLAPAVQGNPDQEAKLRQTAAQLGVPLDAARALPDEVGQQSALQSLNPDQMAQTHPGTARFLSDPSNAAVAWDDAQTLKQMEESFGTAKLLGLTASQQQAVLAERMRVTRANQKSNLLTDPVSRLNQGIVNPFAGILKTFSGPAVAAADTAHNIGDFLSSGSGYSFNQLAEDITAEWRTPTASLEINPLAAQATKAGKTFQQNIEAGQHQLVQQYLVDPTTGKPFLNPDFSQGKATASSLYSTVASIPGTLGTFMLLGKMATPAAESGTPMAEMAPQVGMNRAASVMAADPARERYERALQEGQTPAQAAERAITSYFLNYTLMTKVPAPSEAKTLLGQTALAGARGATLGATLTGAENLASNATGQQTPLTQGMLENVASFMAFEGVHPATRAIDTLLGNALGSQIADAAKKSKLRGRDADTFATAAQGLAEGTQAENVRIPVEEFDRHFSQSGVDPAAMAASLGVDNYAEARDAGTDLVMPVGQWAAKLSPTPDGDALRQHVRFAPGALTEAEMARYLEAPEDETLRQQVQDAAQPDALSAARQPFHEDVLAKLQAAGFAPSVAKVYADFYGSAMGTPAQRAGVSADELMAQFPLQVGRELRQRIPDETLEALREDEPFRLDLLQGPVERRDVSERGARLRELRGRLRSGEITPEESAELNQRNEVDRLQAKVGGRDIQGVGNAVAYAEAKDEETLKPVQIFLDADNFKALNDKMGHAAGDEAIRAMGEVLGRHFGEGNAFHRSGDEFLAQANTEEEAHAKMQAVREELAQTELHAEDQKTGERRVQKGLGLSYGAGATDAEAEDNQYADKERRKLAGLRFDRAAQPGPDASGLAGERVQPDADVAPAGREAALSQLRKLDEALQGLGIDPREMRDNAEIRSLVDAARQDPAKAEAVQKLDEALGSRTLFQRGKMEFGSKEWNEYYAKAKGSLTAKGEVGSGRALTKKARAAMKEAMSKRGLSEEDARREAEAQDERQAFEAFNAGVRMVQKGVEEARGAIHFGNHSVRIDLLKDADLTTFIHETGHLYTEVLAHLASVAPESEVAKDYQALREFAGAEGDAPLTVEQHEKIARAHEAYIMEGKAPSSALRAAFRRASSWMVQIYRTIRRLDVELTPQVRAVFDRLYASDEEIQAAHRQVGDQWPTFASAADMGVSEKEFQLYKKDLQKVLDTGKEALSSQLLRAYQRDFSEDRRAERARLREDVTVAVDQRPDQVAVRALQAGQDQDGVPVKLSRKAVVERFGKAAVSGLPRGIFAKEGGGDLDAAAEILGFRSGQDLLGVLQEVQPREKLIQDGVERLYREAHPDPMEDASLPDRAVEALHTEMRGRVLATELQALRRLQRTVEPFMRQARSEERANLKDIEALRKEQARNARAERRAGIQQAEDIPPTQVFRDRAREIIDGQTVQTLDPQAYLAAERKGAREAFEAANRGQYGKAADAKQREILAHHLFLEALKARSDAERVAKRARDLEKGSAQERLGKAGGSFLDQVNTLLDRYDMRQVPYKTLEGRQSLVDWAREQASKGYEPDIDPAVLNEARRANYRQVPMSELRAVGDALLNISHLASQQLKARLVNEDEAYEDARREMVQSARVHEGQRAQPLSGTELNALQKLKDGLASGDALFIKMERVFRWLDGDKAGGPWMKYVFEPMADAQAEASTLMEHTTKHLKAAADLLPKSSREGMADRFKVEGFDQELNRKQILTMALNQGNAENARVLRDGYGVTQREVEAALAHLTADEFRFVDATWRALETLRKPAGDLQKRMTGVEPKWVDPQPRAFKGADGEVVQSAGGYFPLVRDPDRSVSPADYGADPMFPDSYQRATTSQGYLKARNGATYPLLLDFESIVSRHVAGVIQDITHREAVVTANRFLGDQVVRQAVDESLGKAYRKQMQPWLRSVVNDADGSAAQGLSTFTRWAGTLRRNVAASAILYRVASVLIIPTDLFRAVEIGRPAEATNTRVGLRHFAGAFGDFMKSPGDAAAFIRSRSPEMLWRHENLDREVRSMYQRQLADTRLTSSPIQAAAHYRNRLNLIGGRGFELMDAFVTLPSWLGAYKQALEQGHDEDTAARQADSTVRLNFPTAGPKDLVAVQRNEFTKLFTMFGGYGLASYDLMRAMGHPVKDVPSALKFGLGTFMSISMASVAAELITARGPDKDESTLHWLTRKMLFAPLETAPLIRDASEYLEEGAFGKGGDYRFSPVFSAMETAGKGLIAQEKLLEGAEGLEDYSWATAKALGTAFGVGGTAQALGTGKYLRRVEKGQEHPDNGAELAYNAAIGKPKGR